MNRRSGGKVRSFVVIGLGTFGGTVARELAGYGNYVIGVDSDEARVSMHSEILSSALIVDARDDIALREAGVSDCDAALIAVGENLESSILGTINVKTLGVPLIWAKANSKTHHRILSKLGVDRVIHPEVEVGQQIAQVLHNPLVRDYVSLGNGFHIVNIRVPAALDGKPLPDAKHDIHGLRCVAAMRGTEFLGQDGTQCRLAKDDILVLLGRRADLLNFTGALAWS